MRQRRRRKEFTLAQKCLIYREHKGICYFFTNKTKGSKKSLICLKGSRIKWGKDTLHFHHIKFWSDDGNSIIKNGAPVHKTCHIKYHKSHKDSGEVSKL